jgi:hypothetical protein
MTLTESNSIPPAREHQEGPRNRDWGRPTRRWWPVLVPVVLLTIAASICLPSGRHQWALSLVRQPTPYTTLAFDHPADLPATAVVNRPIGVSFSISNREGRALTYEYVLTQNSSRAVTVLRRSARTVAVNGSWNIMTTIRPSCSSSPCRIQVSLPGHPEKIDFLVSLRSS